LAVAPYRVPSCKWLGVVGPERNERLLHGLVIGMILGVPVIVII